MERVPVIGVGSMHLHKITRSTDSDSITSTRSEYVSILSYTWNPQIHILKQVICEYIEAISSQVFSRCSMYDEELRHETTFDLLSGSCGIGDELIDYRCPFKAKSCQTLNVVKNCNPMRTSIEVRWGMRQIWIRSVLCQHLFLIHEFRFKLRGSTYYERYMKMVLGCDQQIGSSKSPTEADSNEVARIKKRTWCASQRGPPFNIMSSQAKEVLYIIVIDFSRETHDQRDPQDLCTWQCFQMLKLCPFLGHT